MKQAGCKQRAWCIASPQRTRVSAVMAQGPVGDPRIPASPCVSGRQRPQSHQNLRYCSGPRGLWEWLWPQHPRSSCSSADCTETVLIMWVGCWKQFAWVFSKVMFLFCSLSAQFLQQNEEVPNKKKQEIWVLTPFWLCDFGQITSPS
jgi:hypothetical protein